MSHRNLNHGTGTQRNLHQSTSRIFVPHFMAHDNWNIPQRARLVWINIGEEGSFYALYSTFVSSFENHLKKENLSISHENHFKHWDLFGTLFDGGQYVRYSVLLYEETC